MSADENQGQALPMRLSGGVLLMAANWEPAENLQLGACWILL